MKYFVSVIIPNYNGGLTISSCLEAACTYSNGNSEVIVVDDCSTDNSREIIERFPCRLITLNKHSGAARARNVGAFNSNGDILFFIDADCVMQPDTIAAVRRASSQNSNVLTGGSYTMIPFDDTFFSAFQSVFVNYSETKNKVPDYIATHALVIHSALFKTSGGFSEAFLPILEDVEFSHRLRRGGCKLVMDPDIRVRHIFNFSLFSSLGNAFRKSLYWTLYSLHNKDLLKDSGTASIELKINVLSFFVGTLMFALFFYFKKIWFLWPVSFLLLVNLFINRKLLISFGKVKNIWFGLLATGYYIFVYPLAVGTGAFAGLLKYLVARKPKGNVS